MPIRITKSGLYIGRALALSVLALTCIPNTMAKKDKHKSCPDCHPKMYNELKGKFNHPPFKEKQCEECHKLHRFRNEIDLKQPVLELCTRCHNLIEDLSEEDLHPPLLEEDACLLCHNPHSSDYNKLLVDSGTTVCFQCHDEPVNKPGVHKPYADADCIQCHNPHGSIFPGQLQLPSGYICLGCHDQIIKGFTPPEMHTGDDIRSCEQCHEGHQSEHGKLLKSDVKNLCLGCHEDVAEKLTSEKRHAVLDDGDCLVCHIPHFQKGQTFLVSKQADLCQDCHDPEDDNLISKHAGLKPSYCTSCHDPHGSDQTAMIHQITHPPFADRECESCHEPGISDKELRLPDLCLSCHDEPEPTGGHQPDALKGRICIDCHSPHASQKPNLIRTERYAP